MSGSRRPAAWLEATLQRHWWRADASWLSRLLSPLAWLYRGLAALHRRTIGTPERAPVPLVVVGNLVAGGAGKTPTVIAVVAALRRAGWQPGVISRGYGRAGDAVVEVTASSVPTEVGDEPLLIRRRTGVPVWVARRRIDAARALHARHPEVDVLVADDGLQHHALARDAEVVVFDGRGIGNGRLLPAGPLREPLAAASAAGRLVVYNAAAPSTPLPGALARRALGPAVPLADWARGDASRALPLSALRGRPLLATAGIAEPARFFAMLEAEGLTIARLPLPDHHAFDTLPWPQDTPDVLVTEKDAVKLAGRATGRSAVWVVGLDLQLPDDFLDALQRRLRAAPRR